MTKQPDQLFRDKLENFQLNTPAGTWQKVDVELKTKTNRRMWMKIAAGLLILMAAGIVIWNSLSPVPSVDIAIPENKTETESIVKTPEINIQDDVQVSSPPPVKEIIQQKKKNLASSGKKIVPVIAASTLEQVKDTNTDREFKPEPEPATTSTEIPVTSDAQTASIQSPVETHASVHLVYKVNELNEKYLRKPPGIDTVPVDKKSSPFDVLLSVASNVKNGEHGIGDLREIKDEVLSFSFLDAKKNKN